MLSKRLKIKGIPLFFLVLCFAFVNVNAQNQRLEVLSSSGEDFKKGNYQLSYTIGETVSLTQGNRYYFATQGFHQIEWDAVVIWENEDEFINLEVFPNPYSRNLNVVIPENSENEFFEYRIFDLTFKEVAAGELDQTKNSLEFPFMPTGTYILNITKDQELIKTFRIIKTQ